MQSTRFAANVLDATKAFALTITDKVQLVGVPHSALELYAQYARSAGHAEATAQDGPWRVTLDPPSYVQFMKHAANRELREQVHRAFVTRASTGHLDNTPIPPPSASRNGAIARIRHVCARQPGQKDGRKRR